MVVVWWGGGRVCIDMVMLGVGLQIRPAGTRRFLTSIGVHGGRAWCMVSQPINHSHRFTDVLANTTQAICGAKLPTHIPTSLQTYSAFDFTKWLIISL